MILFCDSSALIKLYLVEAGSDQMHELAAKADTVAVSRIAWVEVQAGFARRFREGPGLSVPIEAAKAAFVADWPHFVTVDLTQQLVELAGDYADAFALRAYDAVQLATAFETARIAQSPLQFACFDVRLNKAAKTLGLCCLPI